MSYTVFLCVFVWCFLCFLCVWGFFNTATLLFKHRCESSNSVYRNALTPPSTRMHEGSVAIHHNITKQCSTPTSLHSLPITYVSKYNTTDVLYSSQPASNQTQHTSDSIHAPPSSSPHSQISPGLQEAYNPIEKACLHHFFLHGMDTTHSHHSTDGDSLQHSTRVFTHTCFHHRHQVGKDGEEVEGSRQGTMGVGADSIYHGTPGK